MNDQPPLRLGFTRGTAPSKWARRWRQAGGGPLELVPVEQAFGRDPSPLDGGPLDVMLERSHPGEQPEGSAETDRTRHAVRLYTEGVALVVPTDHELAAEESVEVRDLALVTLLDHADHAAEWPAAEPWADPSWRPATPVAALELVATGAGAILLPLPLARHLVSKREHAIVPLSGEPRLAGTTIWATWALERDAGDVQQLAGIMRGRTARSSRPAAGAASGAAPEPKAQKPARQKPVSKKPGPKPGSRGAQLAAAREKAERAKALRRAEKKRKRR